MKKHLVLLLLTVFSLHFAGCTSSDEAVTEDAAVTDESLENVDGIDTAASSDASAEGFSDEVGTPAADAPPADATVAEAPPADGAMDAAPPDAGGEIPPADPTLADAGAPGSDTSFVPDAGVDPATDAAATPPPAEEVPPPSAMAEAVPPSEPAPAPSESSGQGIFEEKPKVASAPLKKIETTPFRREGVLLNAVYMARPGDNFSKISKMIYGDNKKSKELKKVNPGLGPKVGDKVYYNSPARPDDEGTLKVYYEDAGIQPETYVMQEGDDFRKKSKELLGHDGAWREIYVTNGMDSTRKVPAGTELKYWKGGAAAATVAANVPPVDTAAAPPPPDIPPPPAMEDPMAAGSMGSEPPPPTDMPPPEMMAENPPPPPPVQEMAPPPPPPPPPEMAPPPPPPTMAAVGDEHGGGNDDLMLALAGGGGVAALLAGLMVMRKRRQQREMAAAFGDTQVGT